MRSKGFTLVELIVVIGILGILAAAAILTINPVAQLQKANDAKRKADINSLRAALELYKIDHEDSQYPAALPDCDEELTDDADTVIYVRETPCDPDGAPYIYDSPGGRRTYTLMACLENENDKDDDPDLTDCGTGYAEYRVFNP